MVQRSKGPSLFVTIGLGITLLGIAAGFTAPPLLYAYRSLTVPEQIIAIVGWASLIAAPLITTVYAALLTARDAGSEAYVMLMMSSPMKRDVVRAYFSAAPARARLVYILPFGLAPSVIAVMVHAKQMGYYAARTNPELTNGAVLLTIFTLIMVILPGAAVGTAAGLRLRDPMWAAIAALTIMSLAIVLIPVVLMLILIPFIPALVVLALFIGVMTRTVYLAPFLFVLYWILAVILWRIVESLTERTLRYAEKWV
jgi:hypothetical protein